MEKTRTSTTGNPTERGYTLIELALVILLIGLMLFIAAPRIRDTLMNDSLSAAVRKITGVSRELRAEAVRQQVDHVLHLDLNGRAYWTYTADMTPEKQQERRKDAVRLPLLERRDIPVYFLRVEIELLSGEEDFNTLISRICFK